MLFSVKSNLIDVVSREIYPAEVTVSNGEIISIKRVDAIFDTYILPGFIDAHVHIESSMLLPSEFARIAVKHGSVGTISDPHEIANVLGIAGVEYMIDNARQVPFHFYFGAPSCVPATSSETAGAVIDSEDIDHLLSREDIVYLAEMMNFPGVIYKDPEVLNKIKIAKNTKNL
ncbi:amidohydrolase family protein [Chryseobacterium carnipullorum]|uniref:amidohydrolase family protein n=1 Tax=Chryseobacterium carnipullorum TaxID=1124835 RepID=UPI002938D250|nr:amidohydrolase family protein [Chryseobacterium carnipullorum]